MCAKEKIMIDFYVLTATLCAPARYRISILCLGLHCSDLGVTRRIERHLDGQNLFALGKGLVVGRSV